jgi:hypothetical protein
MCCQTRSLLGSATGSAWLHRSRFSGGHRIVAAPEPGIADDPIEVPLTTLDAWVATLGVDSSAISFVRVDVNGYEREVLSGSRALLQSPHVAWQIRIDPELLRAAGCELDELMDVLAGAFTHFIDLYKRASGPRVRPVADLKEALVVPLDRRGGHGTPAVFGAPVMNGQTAVEVLATVPVNGAVSARVAGIRAFADGQAGRTAARWAHARQAFWQEMHVELRRHAGNERLRSGSADRCAGSRSGRTRVPRGWAMPRRREFRGGCCSSRSRRNCLASSPNARAATRRRWASIRTAPSSSPNCAIVRTSSPRRSIFSTPAAITVVCVGNDPPPATTRRGRDPYRRVRDRCAACNCSSPLAPRFVIAGGWDLQFISYLVDRPSLTLNGVDPFRLYPVRANGVYLTRTAVDLATGRDLTVDELMTEEYFRQLRHHGHREPHGVRRHGRRNGNARRTGQRLG